MTFKGRETHRRTSPNSNALRRDAHPDTAALDTVRSERVRRLYTARIWL